MKTIGIKSVWLPLSELGKWNAPCQRDLTSLQEDIAQNYDDRAFGVVHVLKRKGKYLIIDGQNRCAALKRMGYNGSHLVPCIDHGGSIITGIGQVYLRDKDRINDDELIAKLARRAGGPQKILGDARGQKSLIGGTIPMCVADQVVGTYNRGRRASDRMLKPFRS